MSETAEFFLGSRPSVVRLDCLEISHPNFSQTYRLVRNAPAGIRVEHDSEPITEWRFDGSGDLIAVGNHLSKERTDEFSVSGRFDKQGASTLGRLIAKADTTDAVQRGWIVNLGGVSGGDHIQFGLISTVVTNNIRVQTVAEFIEGDFLATYDGSEDAAGVHIYVNGVDQALTVIEDNLTGTTLSSASLTIGNRSDGARSFQGHLWDMAVWIRELTAGEASELSGTEDVLDVSFYASANEALWKLDGVDTSTAGGVEDYGPSGFDGSSNFEPTIIDVQEFDYEYAPARVMPIASTDDLVQALAVTLGDVGSIVAKETEAVWAANGMNTRPRLIYRAFRSDNLATPIVGSERTLEIVSITTTREGATFEARAPEFNATRTGELYTLERFPTLRGFT